jgi:hypothetical protein
MRSRACALRSWGLEFLLLNGRIQRARLCGWVLVYVGVLLDFECLAGAMGLLSLKLGNINIGASIDRDVI